MRIVSGYIKDGCDFDIVQHSPGGHVIFNVYEAVKSKYDYYQDNIEMGIAFGLEEFNIPETSWGQPEELKEYRSTTGSNSFIIYEDSPKIGVYFTVVKGSKYQQKVFNTTEGCMEFAFNHYKVPMDSWYETESK